MSHCFVGKCRGWIEGVLIVIPAPEPESYNESRSQDSGSGAGMTGLTFS